MISSVEKLNSCNLEERFHDLQEHFSGLPSDMLLLKNHLWSCKMLANKHISEKYDRKTAIYVFSEHSLFFFVGFVKAAMSHSSIDMNFPGASGACAWLWPLRWDHRNSFSILESFLPLPALNRMWWLNVQQPSWAIRVTVRKPQKYHLWLNWDVKPMPAAATSIFLLCEKSKPL